MEHSHRYAPHWFGEKIFKMLVSLPAIASLRITIPPESVAGAGDKDVFERGLTEADRGDAARECGNNAGDPSVAIGDFEPHGLVEDAGCQAELVANGGGEGLGLVGVDRDRVA